METGPQEPLWLSLPIFERLSIDPQARLFVIRYRVVFLAALNSPCVLPGPLSIVPSYLADDIILAQMLVTANYGGRCRCG